MCPEPKPSAVAQGATIPEDTVREYLARAARLFARKPFKPHPLFSSGHAQTLAAYAWPRRPGPQARSDEERLFDVEPGAKVLAHCRWQTDPAEHPTVVLWHGIEGSSSSAYMIATAHKAFRAGFNVIRMNLRNCGGTEHLTPTLYHGGLSGDLRAVVGELISNDRLTRLFLIGFSLGGNMVLKLAGEYGNDPPREVIAICAVSPSVDLSVSADTISQRSNWVYKRNFLGGLRRRIYTKEKLYPELYDTSEVHLVKTIRDFDERFTAGAHGFANADDYYKRASALPLIKRIRLPTLIIHGQDDPFIPFASLRDPSVSGNPYILLLTPEKGGHVAFLSTETPHEDRFWAENRVVEFCELADQK